ncbi:type II toxin-antitoxin system Phd/YefM family antitoxin [Pelotalea chapellei]|uniref:Antitoxin n=1 Tax=Pelotalea chapellei TaxID=44671 RepID=A0ABS5UAU0_9BACT|nr:type II toxin-antitoxin system Phd/YefM family antitoxin [Pelotalea chapellei]MBT1072791.1 type II toxin-antitoxin system prevent-host-death family antitoxin [Pelotalea chapellei]
MNTNTKFSEDIIPLSDLKVNPGRIVSQVDKTRRPVLLTSRGRGVAVVQSIRDFEEETEERAFLKAVVQGFVDVEQGRTVSLADAKKRLGLE